MKIIKVIAVALSACFMVSCADVSDTPDSNESSSSSTYTTSATEKHSYGIGSGCRETNFAYDIRPYRIYDSKRYASFSKTLSRDELNKYARDRLDSIESYSEMSVRGMYQGCEYDIVRTDKFIEWLNYYNLGCSDIWEDYYFIGYEYEYEEGAFDWVWIHMYMDPSDDFIIITECEDHRAIYEFFNGKYVPEEKADPADTKATSETTRDYKLDDLCERQDIEPPFFVTWMVYYDVTGDGNDDLCVTVSGGDRFFRSYVVIYDYENKKDYVWLNCDCDYSLEMVDGHLVMHVVKGENCQYEDFPDGDLKGTFKYENDELIFVFDEPSQQAFQE